MAALTSTSVARDRVEVVLDAVVHAYAQILFSRSRVVGMLLMAATFVVPRMGSAGLLAVLLATLVARALHFDLISLREGYFGYNALLVGLAGTASLPGDPPSSALLLAGVLGSVLLTAALRSALGGVFNLPALSLPFVAAFHLLWGAAPALGISLGGQVDAGTFASLPMPATLSLYLRSLGAIFFLPRVDVGLVVFTALLLHSRIGVLLSALGFTVAWGVLAAMIAPGSAMPLVLGFNFMLVAIALGGVWFVPSGSSFGLALLGALACGLLSLGMSAPISGRLGLPLLILPFNATVLLVLYALRQRVRDQRPKSVDFLAGSPEENLNYYRTRIARFGARYVQRLSAPFRGRWVCTQGVDGPHTHQGPWREALDFEVTDEHGKLHAGNGKQLADYRCYRLPVLAPADGTVVKVVDGVVDNPVGEVNLDENWGNLVVIYHGPLVYTKLCHLSPGTIKVQEGQIVRRGDALGSCGNSGRSAKPHVHFQIQTTARVGSPSSVVELHDVITEDAEGASQLETTIVPQEGQVLRNIDAQPELARLFELPYDEALVFDVDCDGRKHVEEVTASLDLLGNWLLSSDRGATLFYERTASLFTVYDVLGSRRSLLHVLRGALARVPLEGNPSLRWADFLPLSRFVPWPLSWLDDLVSPFVSGRRLEMQYHLFWEGDRLVVEGAAKRKRGGEPVLQTRAELSRARGLELVQWQRGKRNCLARRRAASTSDNKEAN